MAEGHTHANDGIGVVAGYLADNRITLSGAKACALLVTRYGLSAADRRPRDDDAANDVQYSPLPQGANPAPHQACRRQLLTRLEEQNRIFEIFKRWQPVSHGQLVDDLDASAPGVADNLAFGPGPCPHGSVASR